jgi:hypothetical protein
MNRIKSITAQTEPPINFKGEITQLIDVFVEICFEDIQSVSRITQFKLLGNQMGYSEMEISKVIQIGTSEYQKLLGEVNLASNGN